MNPQKISATQPRSSSLLITLPFTHSLRLTDSLARRVSVQIDVLNFGQVLQAEEDLVDDDDDNGVVGDERIRRQRRRRT